MVYWQKKINQCLFYLAHAIVCELDVPLVVQEDVVQLQVTIDDAFFMKEVQSDTDFSSIKSVREEKCVGPSGEGFPLKISKCKDAVGAIIIPQISS